MKNNLYFPVIVLVLFFISQRNHSQTTSKQNPYPFSQILLNDFIVNDDGSGHTQSNPSITRSENGNVYIVWDDNRNGLTDIFCQAYSGNGIPQDGNFQVNENHSGHHQFPDIASDSSGNFIITWSDARDGTTQIYGQYFQNNGSASGNNFKVSINTEQNNSGNSSVDMNKRGDFIAVWENNYQISRHIYAQLYDKNRDPVGNNIQVNDNTVSNHIFPDVAMDDNRNFVIVWQEERSGQYDIYAQRFNADGNPLWGNFKVNDETNSTNQMHPAIAMDAQGNFIIAWNDWRDGAVNIYCQQFDYNGTKINFNFKVNDDAGANGITYPDAAMDDEGNFVIVWPHNLTGIYGQLFDTTGNKSKTNFKIDSGEGNTRQLLPSVAMADNQLYTSWQDNRLESLWDIYANILNLSVSDTDTVATPVFNPLPGTYTDSVSVTINCPTSNTSVYYTSNGSDPTDMSTLYSTPVHLTSTTTLKARAYKEGFIPSDVVTGTYTIEQGKPATVDTPATIIQLYQGWNLFSFDVQPEDLRITEILGDIISDVDIVVGIENGIEKIYDPDSSETSTLLTFNPLQGYYIHMQNPAVLYITGTEIPANTPISLIKGTNLISYLPDHDLPVEEALHSIMDHVVYVKSIDQNGITNRQKANGGLSYDPVLTDYNTLITMQNGFGYWVNVDTAVTLTYPENSDETLLASTVIGSHGGTFSTDNFILTVPQNAFVANVTLKLYDLSETYNNQETNSTIYGLEGLPQDFLQPLRICVKYTGNLSEENFISVGEEVFIPELLDTELLHFYYPAQDSSGFLVTTLPAGDLDPANSQNISPHLLSKKWLRTGIKIINAVQFRQTYQSKYFTIAYPILSFQTSQIAQIGNYFDAAVQTGMGGTGMGFGVSQLSLLEKKLFHVIIESANTHMDYYLKTEPYKSLIVDILKNYNKCSMHLNENMLSENEDVLQQIAGMLVFGLRQWMEFNDQYYWNWLNYAIELWVGGRFAADPIHYNPFDLCAAGDEQNLMKSPFQGIEKGWQFPEGVSVNMQAELLLKKQHGHGMVGLIKAIERTYKTGNVTKIWEAINSSQIPVEIIMENIKDPEYVWWSSFFHRYVSNNLYELNVKKLLKSIKNKNKFIINDANDIVKDFDRTYPDFSAELFQVYLFYDKIEDLVFTLGPKTLNLDYQTFYIYGLQNNSLQYIGQGIQSGKNIQLTVENIPELMESGYTSLIALVVNSANEPPYTGSVNIEFEVKSQQMLRQSWITFENFTYDGNTVDPYNNVLSRTGVPLGYTLYIPATSEYSENVYEAYWSDNKDSWSGSTGGSDGYIKIEFNFNNEIITFFHFEVVSKEGDISTKELTIEAVDIPYKGKDQYLLDWDVYQIFGEKIKSDHITKFSYVQTDHMSAGDWVTTATDFHTQSNSYLKIYIK